MQKTKIFFLVMLVLLSGIFVKSAKAAVNLDQEEKNFIQILNEYRRKMGRTELKPNNKLIESAEFYADDITKHPSSYNGDHIDSLDRHAEDRGTHYNYYFLTENIARGYETGQQVFDGWKGSPAHYENMTIKEARTIGVARVYSDSYEHRWAWVAVFSDEGVERLQGNQLVSSNLYNDSDYPYKKMSVTVKKKTKLKKWAEVKIYEVTKKKAKKGKKAKITKIRMVDRDITDTKQKATLYSIGAKYVQVEVYKLRGDKKPVKTKLVKWNKNLSLSFSL